MAPLSLNLAPASVADGDSLVIFMPPAPWAAMPPWVDFDEAQARADWGARWG